MPSSRGSSQPRDQAQVSCIAGRFFTVWATREAYIKPNVHQLLVQPRTPKSSWQKQALLNDASKQLLCTSLLGMSDFIGNSQRNEIFDTCWGFYSLFLIWWFLPTEPYNLKILIIFFSTGNTKRLKIGLHHAPNYSVNSSHSGVPQYLKFTMIPLLLPLPGNLSTLYPSFAKLILTDICNLLSAISP